MAAKEKFKGELVGKLGKRKLDDQGHGIQGEPSWAKISVA